jgi:hypothetical protein
MSTHPRGQLSSNTHRLSVWFRVLLRTLALHTPLCISQHWSDLARLLSQRCRLQLSWQQGIARRFNFPSFRDSGTLVKLREHTYWGQGWGLCNNGEHLVMSNGTEWLQVRSTTIQHAFLPASNTRALLLASCTALCHDLLRVCCYSSCHVSHVSAIANLLHSCSHPSDPPPPFTHTHTPHTHTTTTITTN